MPPMRSGSTSARVAEEGHGGAQVSFSRPAERVGVALALALAAAVEEEDAVAVPREHPRLPLRALPAGERDHSRAVLRGHVPAFELEAVARRESDVFIGSTERRRRHEPAREVRIDVRDVEREDDEVGGEEPGEKRRERRA